LKRRTARAKAFNYRAAVWDGSARLPTKTKFDGILVDAPCSGLGTWQRNPHARWTTTVEDVRELAEVQKRLLTNVAGSVKPGGKLIFAVCTLTRDETTGVVEHFNTTQPEFEPLPLPALQARGHTFGHTPTVMLWPQDLGGNGMFIAGWRRKKG
jgi:16S rRNA (cytosine967-C5)-methyltransferase